MAKVSISEKTRVPRKKYVASNKVDDLRLYQLSCLGSFGLLSLKTFKLYGFPV
jgi:hypothetical protein